MGREVTITEPALDADGFFPKGPASVCIEGPPQRQCYTAPKDFGRDPQVTLIQVEKDMPALLFSAASGGVSGFGINFALLRPGKGNNLENLFLSDLSVSNQSQHAFWTESAISNAPIFLTAEYSFGPDEGHYGEHRFVVSAYIRKPSSMIDGVYYWLEDQYLTIRKYDLDANADILASEKQEILARLARVKAETERQKRTPR
ncbi:MAG: hypothetical protein LAO55_15075 [Acidobacteriia bacterium]|nr:hypothetical protein [Terriglobia bacterium]